MATLQRPTTVTDTNQTFQFEELNKATAYPRSVLRAFKHYSGRHILEIGSGVGNFTRFICAEFPDRMVTMLEPNPRFCEELRAKHPDLDLHNGTSSTLPQSFRCDTIFNVNVLEHIEDDVTELNNYARLLSQTGGFVCLFLPARPEIYAPIDRAFGHYRRYTKRELRSKLEQAGFEIVKLRYSNSIGYFGWALEFKWRKQMRFAPWKVLGFDRLIWPLLSRAESMVPPPIGQNLLAIAKVEPAH